MQDPNNIDEFEEQIVQDQHSSEPQVGRFFAGAVIAALILGGIVYFSSTEVPNQQAAQIEAPVAAPPATPALPSNEPAAGEPRIGGALKQPSPAPAPTP